MNNRNILLRILPPLAVVLFLILIGGSCVGYRVGSMLPDKYQSVAVPTFVNETGEPMLENETTSAAISEIQMDGSLVVADIKQADTILRVKLTGFELRPISYSNQRSRLAREYRMQISASLELSDRETGEVIVESPAVRGFADFIVSGDLSSSKQTAIPNASRDLAHKIVERIVEVW